MTEDAKAWAAEQIRVSCGGIRKISHYMPVSRALLDDLTREPTAEQREQYRQRREAKAAQAAERVARHERLIAETTGVQHAVLVLHAPVAVDNTYGHPRHICEGCDMDGYEAESPEWPCRTWAIASEEDA